MLDVVLMYLVFWCVVTVYKCRRFISDVVVFIGILFHILWNVTEEKRKKVVQKAKNISVWLLEKATLIIIVILFVWEILIFGGFGDFESNDSKLLLFDFTVIGFIPGMIELVHTVFRKKLAWILMFALLIAMFYVVIISGVNPSYAKSLLDDGDRLYWLIALQTVVALLSGYYVRHTRRKARQVSKKRVVVIVGEKRIVGTVSKKRK